MSNDRRQSGLWSRNPDTGFFHQVPIPSAQIQPKGPYQYYTPTPQGWEPPRRSFSERTARPSTDESFDPTTNGVARAGSRKERGMAAARDISLKIGEPMKELLDQHPETTSQQLSATQHVSSTAMPASAQQPPLRVDPDYVPANLRTTAWSPDPMSPRQKNRQTSNASSGMADPSRKASVPGRSPLQSLELWTKEEKRARMEQAETRARERSLAGKGEGDLLRSATLRSERARVVSDGVARRTSQPQRKSDRRQVSDPISPNIISPEERFQSTNTASKDDGRQEKSLSRQGDPRPLPTVPRPHERQAESSKVAPRNDRPSQATEDTTVANSAELARSQSGKYKHRARDAGFAGAAAAYTARLPSSSQGGAAERGKAAYERSKSSYQDTASPVSPISQDSDRAGLGIDRSGSKRLQKRSPLAENPTARDQPHASRTIPAGDEKDLQAAQAYQQPGPIPPSQVQNAKDSPVKYAIPPQTLAGQQAKEQVAFGAHSAEREKHHRFGDMFHRHEHRGYIPSAKPLEDWRQAQSARLTVDDLDFERPSAAGANGEGGDAAWWEKSRRSSSMGSKAMPNLPQYDGPYEEQSKVFQPFVFLKCGPLLRYTGIRKEGSHSSTASAKEVWRGSIMIVTDDQSSDLSRTPNLRLFAQPMELHQPLPPHMLDSGHQMPPEYEDPVTGQVKVSRTGRPLYVRPVQELDGDVDLSREENNEGLFAATRTRVLGPQTVAGPDGRQGNHITFQDKSRIAKRDGERAGRYREVKATRLHTERGCTFWRFNIEVELGRVQYRVAYRINNGPAIGFWVPAKGETMNIMFHSCNGFSASVDSNEFSGPDPLWRDVLNRHQSHPFHVMLGGGDQIYNDAVTTQTTIFKEWSSSKNPEFKRNADFSPEMQDELEEFYLNRYAMWFSQGLFGMANSQIPMVNIWDDHDIIDGYGSYPHHFMSSRVFTGVGAVAYKYYMLFQHQSLSTETEKEEPSWLLGSSPGPYINELSRNLFMSLGNKVAFLGLDCRTERMRDEVLSQETYDRVFHRCRDEITKGETKHLIVLLGVPIAYPRLNFLENVLTSRAMMPIKAIGRTGMLGGFVNKFDGGVEILDDLDDHWTAKHHKGERNWFIEELQELAAEKSVRVTILGGDVHLGAIGQFYSAKKFGLAKDRDHRYMPNVVSSAIVNTPPPTAMADVLNKRNKIHRLNTETDEDMIPMFSHDVDGSRRNNCHLLPRRNFCIIREYVPGSTPPGTPSKRSMEFGGHMGGDSGDAPDDRDTKDRRFPPGSMKRTMSLTRGPVNLVRRLSGSSKSRKPPISLAPEHARPYNEEEKPMPRRTNSLNVSRAPGNQFDPDGPMQRPTFHRRPTDLSVKEAKKAAAAAADGNLDGRQPGHVDLEGGLDISLCVEIDQHNPMGATVPYRLLVPSLWYEGPGDPNPEKFKSHRGSFMDRLRWNRKREALQDGEDDQEWTGSEGSRTPSPPRTSQDHETERNTAANAMGLTSTGRGAYGRADPYNASGTNGPGLKDATPRAPKSNTYTANTSVPIAAPSEQQHNSGNAYNQGYKLSSPPIGTHHTRDQHVPTGQAPIANNKYPQSGYRRASAPISAQTRGALQTSTGAPRENFRAASGPQHTGGYDGYDSEGSLTPSEVYSDDEYERRQAQPQARRASKTERFFGIGDAVRDAVGGGGRRSMQTERPAAPPQADEGVRYSVDGGRPDDDEWGRGGGSVRRGGGWKIWKRGAQKEQQQ